MQPNNGHPRTRYSLLSNAVELCRSMLEEQESFILGARQLVSLIHSLNLSHLPEALIITAIDSETDALPLGQVRQYWQPEALKKLELEIDQAEKWATESGKEACKAIADICRTEMRNIKL